MPTPSHPTELSSFVIIEPRIIFRIGLQSLLQRLEPTATITEVAQSSEWLNQSNVKATPVIFLGASSLSELELHIQITKLRTQAPACKIVLYHYRYSWESLLEFFRMKISGYLNEDFDVLALEQCLQYIQRNYVFLGPEMVAQLVQLGSTVPAKSAKLSKMENEVAGYLVQGMNVSKIAQKMERQVSTISTVKANIQKKLHVTNIIDMAKALR